MCWAKIKAWFHREEKPWQPPHPEEPANSALTITAEELLDRFLSAYHVPIDHFPSWRDIDLAIISSIGHPAETIAQLRQIRIKPEFANPGTLAHEAAHIVYDLLTPQQRADFRTVYTEELATRDSLVQRLYEIKKQNMLDPVEAHAECYRFLAESLPDNLKGFYPRLFA